MDKDKYKDRIKKQIEVMEAYLEGKDIQVSYGGGIWDDTEYPEWNWDIIKYRVKPDEVDEPKKLMTYRQLAELMAKGYGEFRLRHSLLVKTHFKYDINNEDKPKNDVLIRPWGSDEWLDPTVDIYEEFMNSKEKERRYQNIKISIKKLNGDDFEVESEPDEETIKDYSDCCSVEPKIGEVFKYKGLTLRCEEGGCGDGCALLKHPCYAFECLKGERVDGKGVRFVDVSKMENTTASEESSSTEGECGGVHKRTPQEIADFFNCYVAMDEDGYWYLYNEEPIIGKDDFSWSTANCGTGEILSVSESFLLLNAEEDHNWRTLYRPHREPIVMEEE